MRDSSGRVSSERTSRTASVCKSMFDNIHNRLRKVYTITLSIRSTFKLLVWEVRRYLYSRGNLIRELE